jgi:hypothetical protein
MSSVASNAAKIVLAIGGVLVALFAVYGTWLWWDIHRVRSFCQEIHVGMPLAALPQLAEKHSIAAHWIRKGVYDDSARSWVFFVPVEATMGDMVCAIHHNNASVLSFEFYGN